ncbi:MAG: Zn-dependent alcohol dehydrogenase [Candidatus Lambdaproteobacteria bacterium]|nr:Zn-dependent alcohol dehydrogenase [Candidatus Lambdaproteobacteria bacterium]
MKMKAAVLNAVNEPLAIEEVELDPPRGGEVLVQLKATGVCHSDVHYVQGDNARELPLILGHEGAGIVQEVGPGVTRVKPGDHVVLSFLPSCGTCRWCRSGHPVMCDVSANLRGGTMPDGTRRLHRSRDGRDINNFLFVSTFAEYSVVPEASVIPVPVEAPLERICLLGCGFTTGFGTVTNVARVQRGESVTIIGCGGLGLAAIQAARLAGAATIVAVDVHEEKLAMAKAFGATHTLISRRNNDQVLQEIMALTDGLGTDYSLEFVGGAASPATADLAFRAIRKCGTMCFAGLAPDHLDSMPISPKMLMMQQKRVVGAIFGDSQFRSDIPRYVELYMQRQINLDDMVSQEIPLEDINSAVQEVIAGNKVARQVIRF